MTGVALDQSKQLLAIDSGRQFFPSQERSASQQKRYGLYGDKVKRTCSLRGGTQAHMATLVSDSSLAAQGVPSTRSTALPIR
jgi:hypothetical protein